METCDEGDDRGLGAWGRTCSRDCKTVSWPSQNRNGSGVGATAAAEGGGGGSSSDGKAAAVLVLVVTSVSVSAHKCSLSIRPHNCHVQGGERDK